MPMIDLTYQRDVIDADVASGLADTSPRCCAGKAHRTTTPPAPWRGRSRTASTNFASSPIPTAAPTSGSA
jgi:hypothetical protein